MLFISGNNVLLKRVIRHPRLLMDEFAPLILREALYDHLTEGSMTEDLRFTRTEVTEGFFVEFSQCPQCRSVFAFINQPPQCPVCKEAYAFLTDVDEELRIFVS